MTIASCYVSPEGVVFGADSTSTYNGANGQPHYYNHAQKLFEIGTGGTLAMVTWGLGGLALVSYRKMLAQLADDLSVNAPTSVNDVALRWAALVWAEYQASDVWPLAVECRRLEALQPFDPSAVQPAASARTKDEEAAFQSLRQDLFAGFCIGGYVASDRTPEAYTMGVDPLGGPPVPTRNADGWSFWGAPNMIKRLLFGIDDGVRSSILNSGNWNGTPQELDALAAPHHLAHPSSVPMREAIDFVHSCIYSTIKAMKFSNLPQICGGPIEIAVVTVDRPFRWVRHKAWDTAINESGGYDVA